jgi:hypothetical protein
MLKATLHFEPSWIENGELEICSVATAQQKGVWTNRLGRLKSDPSKLLALIASQSHGGEDFPIGKNGLDYIKAAQAKGRDAIVVMVRYESDGKLKYVTHRTIEEIEADLRSCRMLEGKWGFYWWWSLPVEVGEF